jgi:hypothetical protein
MKKKDGDRSILLSRRSIAFLHDVVPGMIEVSFVVTKSDGWMCVRSARFGAWCSDMILYQLQSLLLVDLLRCVRSDLVTLRKLGKVLGVSQPASQSEVSHSFSQPVNQPFSQSVNHLSARQSVNQPASQSASHSPFQPAGRSVRHSVS